ncbi:type IV secretory system conjugative DNA transfer family protein [Streptomyces sp. DSM 44915]|uniref:Type IV secretory system conjugative DNA transfer family protein n=1 Tax=Streptomyces chisholmiae TaxID=3075540 RepID=A0ABU2JQF3_9ACTN|nr:type IV secretory system conjugative DNA transfer family protein [Streptomyces sp. DSM 44915]MDT0267226.1 type IV secretory system conjugative DNA transfer family protein [Streptomyces sp. DSM 44915]
MTAPDWLTTYLVDPVAVWPAVAEHARSALAEHRAPLTALPAATLTVIGGRALLARWRARRLARGGRCVVVQAPPRVDEHGAEVLWSSLSGLLRPWWHRLLAGQPHVAFEYAWTREGMTIRLWVPRCVPVGLVRQAVHAAWPGAHTVVVPAAPPVPAGQAARGGRLRLARSEVLPLRTAHRNDPLRALLQAAAGLRGAERAVVQVLARPATGRRRGRTRRAARVLKTGRTQPLRGLRGTLAQATHRPQPGLEVRQDAEHSGAVRQAAEKLSGSLWAVSLLYAVSAPPGPDARRRARARAHALASSFGLYTARNWLVRARLPRPHRHLARRHLPRRAALLSVPELATLAHLPTDPDAPGLARAGARSLPPPPGIPAPAPDARPLGRGDTDARRHVALATGDARHHLHLMGATGSGKSTLITNLALDDVRHGRGLLVVDPKGDLVTDLLDRLPAECGSRLTLIDPDDPRPPPCLNVLEGQDTDVVVDNATSVFRKIHHAFWGPRTDDLMRGCCLTLVRHRAATGQPVTLADIPRLLAEPAYRLRVTAGVRDPVLRGFWAGYDALSEPARQAVTAPLLNKLRALLLRDFARRAIAHGPSTADLSDVLDGGILLARLPKGSLGEETARLLGSFLLAQTWQAATARARRPEHARIDASVYLDECHNFLHLPYPLEEMLAEARGYRVSFNLAHQHLAQLPTELREAISTNARNKVFFAASPEDARHLEHHTQPGLAAHDLTHLGRHRVAARLLVQHTPTAAFTLTTHPAAARVPGRADQLRALANQGATPPPTTREATSSTPTPAPSPAPPSSANAPTPPATPPRSPAA